MKFSVPSLIFLLHYEIILPKQCTGNDESSLLFEAVLDGNRTFVKQLIDCRAVDVNTETTFGLTGLMQAAGLGRMFIVELLLDNGAAINTRHVRNGWTSLMYASANGWVDTVKLLLNRGADYEITDSYGRSAYSVANGNGIRDLLLNTSMIGRASPTVMPMRPNYKYGRTNLDYSYSSSLNRVDGLKQNLTYPLHAAVVKGFLPLVKSLIYSGADVNYQDSKGVTALMLASYYGYTDIITLLLSSEAQINIQCKQGWSALMYAISRNLTKVVKLLVDKGANVNVRSNLNLTALMLASMDCLDSVNLLITQGADVNASDINGATAVFYAAESRHLQVLKLLAANDAEIDPRKADGSTPLMFAVAKGDLPGVKALLDFGADANAKTLDGSTALMRAAYNNDEQMVTLLMDFYQADIFAKNINGYTAADFASDENVRQLLTPHIGPLIKIVEVRQSFQISEAKHLEVSLYSLITVAIIKFM